MKKPRRFDIISDVNVHRGLVHITFHGFIGGIGLEMAKRYYVWLGQAIAYLESKQVKERK